jgi:UDP:flavonoid glycosyltransferase YjiC (YdhE family)
MTLIFAINTSLSHFHSTFWLAGQLKQRGHRIIYFAASDESVKEIFSKYRDLIESRGFEFLQMDVSKIISVKENDLLRRKNIFTFRTNGFGELIAKYKPDVVFLDSLLAEYAIILHRFHLKIVMVQTMLCLDKAPFIPPANSNFIPLKKGISSFIRTEWEWNRLFLKKWIGKCLLKIYFLGADPASQLTRMARANRFDLRNVYAKRPFTFGIKDVPELILSAQDLDLPRSSLPSSYHFIGPAVDMARDESLHTEFNSFIASMPFRKYEKVIYCSLGTMAPEHNSHCLSFFIKVISIFSRRPRQLLILSAGNLTGNKVFDRVPDHIRVFSTVSQISLLKESDLMLTSAGINSITECMLMGVPLIVFPLSPEWDQNGNAARVVYHGIGLRGDIKRDTEDGIEQKIDLLLSDKNIAANVKRLQMVLQKKNMSRQSIDLTESLIMHQIHLPTHVHEPVD